MRGLLIVFIMIFFTQPEVFAQTEFRLGVHAGLPVGQIETSSNLKAGLEVAYMYSIEDVFEVGPLAGYSHYFIKEGIDLPYYKSSESQDVHLIPLAVSGRVYLAERFFMGVDGGYALSLSNWTNGGIYYRPKIGFVFYGFGIKAFYEGVNMDEGIISSVNLGVEISL